MSWFSNIGTQKVTFVQSFQKFKVGFDRSKLYGKCSQNIRMQK